MLTSLLLDLIMLVLLALMYRKRAISMKFHEWGGIALFGLFLIHKALNWKWICAVTGGIFRGKGKPNGRWIVDVLLDFLKEKSQYRKLFED